MVDKSNPTEQTYAFVSDYIMDRDTCSSECIFSDMCPAYAEGLLKTTCIIKRDKMFDVFFNLFIDPKKGIDTEIMTSLYTMKDNAQTPDEIQSYLNMLVKVKTAFYGPDKNKETDDLTNVSINIVPVEVAQSNKEVKNSKKVVKKKVKA